MRLLTVGFALAALATAVPALALEVVVAPGPEAGVGLGALAALGVSYAVLRAKLRRS